MMITKFNKYSRLIFNKNNKIKVRIIEKENKNIEKGRYNKVFINDEPVCNFGVAKYGRIYSNENPLMKSDKYYDNSMFFEGGFIVEHKLHNNGIGRNVIKEIFKLIPELENILLFALEEQGAVPFWLKIGGEIEFEYNGLFLIKLNRNKIL